MRCLLTTQSQNGYREQIQKEILTRLAWKSRYADLYSCYNPQNSSTESTQLPHLPTDPPGHLGTCYQDDQRAEQPSFSTSSSSSSSSCALSGGRGGRASQCAPLMRPVSPQTRLALYQDSSHHGKGRSLYLKRRGHIRPEEKFDFPLLSSWEYGWRLGDYTLDYRTPSRAKSSVVKNTFYARNGVFCSPSATDTLG